MSGIAWENGESMTKTRIAILGGGPAALATAFELSATEDLRERFEIDLYQIGWRLGGKCASSRNSAARFRNEEHGLHVLGGFYHNVFSQVRPLYEAWPTVSPDTAIDFESAFHGHNTFTLMQPEGEGWRAISVDMPTNDKELGVDPEPITPVEMLTRILSWIGQALEKLARGESPAMWLHAVEDWNAPDGAGRLADLAQANQTLAVQARQTAADGHPESLLNEITGHLGRVQAAIRGLGQNHPPQGPDWIGVIELIASVAHGLAADRVGDRGFDAINGLDASAWLTSHGASARAVACPLLQAGYHYAFAFEAGDWQAPNIAAGVAMRGLLRMVFGYHRSVLIHMNGGMGEMIVTPYYEVLRARSVRFHFFHRVESLTPGPDGLLASVGMRIQAKVAAGSAAYEPLIDYRPGDGRKPRRCWPDGPDCSQLSDGAAVAAGPNLEKWIDSAGVGEVATLEAGRDFDLCVLGVSMGVLREISQELAAANPAWARMLASSGVAPTIAAQIWRTEKAETFHGVAKDRLMTGFSAPLDTWADMSFLAPLEQPVPGGGPPASLSYLCGPITGDVGSPDRRGRAARETQAWLTAHAAQILPGLDDDAGGYRSQGEIERYVRINDDPIDLYVCSPAGSVDHRLRHDQSGFDNLRIVGDWTRNNFDCGAVETAILSAKLCARGISGSPVFIYGESDFA